MSSGNSNGSLNSKNINFSNNSSVPKHMSSINNNSSSSNDFISRLMSSSPSKTTIAHNTSPSTGSPIYLAETGRRPSGTMSRGMSYLYNNSFLNGGMSNNSSNNNNNNNNGPVISPKNYNNNNNNNNHEYNSTNIDSSVSSSTNIEIPNQNKFSHSLLPSLQNEPSFNETERSYFQSSNEILACDKSWETPNLIAIATPRNLQLLKVSNTDISLETELVMKQSGKAKIGTISDLSFGHQQYGRYLASSTITGSINIYHFDRGNRIKTSLIGHKRAVNSIDFNRISPYLLLSGSQDGKILIWDLRTSNSKPQMTLNGMAEAVRCCKFNNKKGNILSSVFDSGVIEKWDLRKNSTWEKRINAHSGPALTVDWHPELDYVITGGRDKQLQVWNLDSNSNDSKEPCHTIYTSDPIFKAKWCKGRGNNSILNTDIAISFFNNNSSVEIWNLNRKFIPKSVLNGHSAQITQILWRTPKHLITCSKDKSLIQYDVLKEKEFINNIKNGSLCWNPIQVNDLTVIKQDKFQFQGPFNKNSRNDNVVKEEEIEGESRSNSYNDLETYYEGKELENRENEDIKINFNNNIHSNSNSDDNIYKNNGDEENYFTNNNHYKSHSMLIHNNNNTSSITPPDHGMQLYEMSNSTHNAFSPTISSSFKFHRPTIMQSRQPSQVRILSHNYGPPPSWITPIHLPLPNNNIEKFKLLSSNYIIKDNNIDDVNSIVEICEYNAMIAAFVGFFRDCQTWRSIKMSIILDNEVKEEEEIENKLLNFAFDRKNSFSHSESNLGTSYGSESDVINNLGSEVSNKSYDDKSFDKSNSFINENAVEDDEGDTEDNDLTTKDNFENTNNLTDLVATNNSTQSDISHTKNQILADDVLKHSEDSKNKNEPVSVPIDIDNKFRNRLASNNIRPYRYSFTGSSVDFDDEKSGSPLSLSSSPLMKKTRSRIIMSLTSNANDDPSFHVSQSLDTRLSKTSDTKSQLTSIMKENNSNNKEEAGSHKSQSVKDQKSVGNDSKTKLQKKVHEYIPWNPSDMIEKACQYSNERGDIITCASLALLFATKYPNAIPAETAEEWIYEYHELLLRSGYFNNAATVLRIASETYESFKTIGQTKTSVKTLCCHCKKPLINESSKDRLMLKEGSQFGFWYCDRCHKQQSGCSYCGEPIKGNIVTLMGCGHGGHFGCFRSWFVDQNERECPLCGNSSVM